MTTRSSRSAEERARVFCGGVEVVLEPGERLVLQAIESDVELVAQEAFVEIDVIEAGFGGSADAGRIHAGVPRCPEHRPREVVERVSGKSVAPIEDCTDPVV